MDITGVVVLALFARGGMSLGHSTPAELEERFVSQPNHTDDDDNETARVVWITLSVFFGTMVITLSFAALIVSVLIKRAIQQALRGSGWITA